MSERLPLRLIVSWDADGSATVIHGVDNDPIMMQGRYHLYSDPPDLAARIRKLEAKLAASESAARETALQYLSDMGQADERYDALYRAAQVMADALQAISECAASVRGETLLDDERLNAIQSEAQDALSTHKGAGNE